MEENKVLTREDILTATDRSTKTISVPEWGGDIIIATLSGTERDRFEDYLSKRMRGVGESRTITDTKNLRVTLLQMCLVDSQGNQLFADKSDLDKLNAKNAQVISRIFTEAQNFNGLSEESIEEKVGN